MEKYLSLVFCLLVIRYAKTGLMQTLEETSSCNISMIMEDLSADSVCLNSYNNVATGNSSQIDLSVIYLCGTHCGVRFYNATKRACNGTELDFLQLHCSRNTLFQGEETIFCAYSELYEDLSAFPANCELFAMTGTCSSNCSSTLSQILNTLGCCLVEQYNSSIGFLRPDNPVYSLFGNEMLYGICNLTAPGECVPTYVDGNPVFVDPTPPSPPTVVPTVPPTSTATSDSHKMEVRSSQVVVYCLFSFIMTRLLVTIVLVI